MSSISRPWKFEARTPSRLQVLHLARRVAASSCPIMILGPTGVGKEVLAKDIHQHSGRASGPFVSVNCASFPPALFDCAFFGHVRGSFTGATNDKPGFIELAHGGTLFLDEVGDLPLDAQGKLLRFIANGTYWPVGGTAEKRPTVRIISATHRRIDPGLVDTFREDLFFRLSVVLLRIPPLEVDDIGAISKSLAIDALSRHEKSLSEEAIEELSQGCMSREWRGGVREMHNTIERFVVLLDERGMIADQVEQALGIDRTEVPSGIRARKCESDLAKLDSLSEAPEHVLVNAVLQALGRVLARGGQVTIHAGNCDIELTFAAGLNIFREALGQPRDIAEKILFAYRDSPEILAIGGARILITYGAQDDRWNKVDYEKLRRGDGGYVYAPGSVLVKKIFKPETRLHACRKLARILTRFAAVLLDADPHGGASIALVEWKNAQLHTLGQTRISTVE